MGSIFLAHSSKDKLFTRQLAADLLEKGIRVWFDEAEMMVGDSIINKINEGIRTSEYLGVVLSPNSASSKWVKKELEIAMTEEIQTEKVKVLPILYEECNIPEFLKTKVWADFSNHENYHKSLDKLTKCLLKNKSKETFRESTKWTPKGVRLGLMCGLVVTSNGNPTFSKKLFDNLCKVGKNWWNQIEELEDKGELIAEAAIGAIANEDKSEKVLPLTLKETTFLLNEISDIFLRDIFNSIDKMGIIIFEGERMKWADGFHDELIESLSEHADFLIPYRSKADKFIKDFFVEAVQARLLIFDKANIELKYYIGMVLFDMFKSMPMYKDMMEKFFNEE